MAALRSQIGCKKGCKNILFCFALCTDQYGAYHCVFWNFAERVSTVLKTIKLRAGRFKWKSGRSAKGCGLYANGRIMIGRSYLASRQVMILPKVAELAFHYFLGTLARQNGSLGVVCP